VGLVKKSKRRPRRQPINPSPDVRPVVKWPPGLLAFAREQAGPGGFSAWVTQAALDTGKELSHDGLHQLADSLHELALEQVTLGTRARHLAKQGRQDEAQQAQDDQVAFVPGSVQISDDLLEAVSAAAQAAGFLRHDDAQPRGNSMVAGRSRSFTAFLRAAVALRFGNMQLALAKAAPARPGGWGPEQQAEWSPEERGEA
jgi:hypothetical protein